MMTNQRALDLIETALRAEPRCACGEPTTIVAQGDQLRLVCSSLNDRRPAAAGPLGRLVRVWLDPTHVSRVVLEDPIVTLAA